MDDQDQIRLVSGEFRCRDEERAWRSSQLDNELRQVRLLWGAAMVCFGAFLWMEYTVQGGRLPEALLWPRAGILLVGMLVLLLLGLPGCRQHRDAITSAGLVVAMALYGALLAARDQQSAGALLLLLLGSYLFSPGSFALHCITGAAGSLAAAVVARGAVPWQEFSYLAPANVLAALALSQLNRGRRRLYRQGQRLQREVAHRRQAQARLQSAHRDNLALLYNALPRDVAQQLRRAPGCRPARQLPAVTLLFADIVGFSTLARRLSPAQLLEVLDELFSSFDGLADGHGLEKIKTIGDAYFAAAGLLAEDRQPAARAAAMALALRKGAAWAGLRCGLPLQLRIGLHTGPVVAGVLGKKRYAFDVWGEAVNIASRLQAAAPPGAILVSEQTRRHCLEGFRFGPPQALALRGCGTVVASRLVGELPAGKATHDPGGNGLG